jgi:transcription initiation factor TFIIIB Brf1 subunit/transcription initiation factor TFIIB
VYRASDRVAEARWIERIEAAADELGVSGEARSAAVELFLSEVPEDERSKPAVAAASLYAGTLIAGDERSQAAVADAAGVSRLSVQRRWKPLLEAAGLSAPDW